MAISEDQATAKQVQAGQAVYSKRVLSIYDFTVLGVSNRYIWRCSTATIEAHYNRHLSANHLDVGVGSGYFLDQCQFPGSKPRLALMDLNQNSLAYAAQRVARYQPEQYVQNVLQPIEQAITPFDSVGINYLLHCIPGTMHQKAKAFDHLAALMNPGAKLFGATILQGDVPRNLAAKGLMAIYNKRGIFSNKHDGVQPLTEALNQRFSNVEVNVEGCVALFSGKKVSGQKPL